MTRPRYGLNGATTGPTPLLRDLEAARDAGYDDLEIRDTKLEAYLRIEALGDLRERLGEAALRPLSLNALEDATLGDAGRVLSRAEVLCEWAQALGAPYVIAVPSRRPPDLADAEVQRRTAERLAALADLAAGYGVIVGFEFLGFPWCSIPTLAAAKGAVAEASSDNLGIVVDAFHFYAGGSALDDLEDLANLVIVHLDDAEAGPRDRLTDAQRLLPGEGVIPLREIAAAIRRSGYAGSYSLELFRPEYYTLDPGDLARRGLAAMRAVVE